MLNGSQPPLTLRLVLEPEPDADADAEEAERLGRQLGAELRELDVDSVQPAGERAAPDGAKGVATSLAELLVTMSGTGGVLATVVATIRDWLGRRRDAGRVVLTIDGDTLELSSASSAERTELVDAFVRRHSGAG
jgi:Effector Associated Constant Component 1